MKFINAIFEILHAMGEAVVYLADSHRNDDFFENEISIDEDSQWRSTNPATGLPMICGGYGDVDIAGNSYGSSSHHDCSFMSTTHNGHSDHF